MSSPVAKATDVAKAAGVSIATVSLVVNGKSEGRVSQATRRRVERAIAELSYEVNSAARTLATGRRHCIAFVASDVANPFISTIAAGIGSVLGTDYQLLLAISGSERALPDVKRVLAFGVDGILLDLPLGAEVRKAAPHLPLVALDDPASPEGISRVRFGLGDAAAELAEHLASLGHRTVVYLDAARPWATFRSRRDTVAKEARRCGMTIVNARSAIEIDATRQTVAQHLGRWLDAGVTAVVAASDIQAYGALDALRAAGVGVPAQVSLASFDGLPLASITNPPLTTVSLPAFDLGSRGAQLMLRLIEAPDGAFTAVQLPAVLEVRESTGPAPRAGRRRRPL